MEAPVCRAAPVPFRSKVEMYEEISQLRPFLSSNTELDLRIKALQRLEAVMVGGEAVSQLQARIGSPCAAAAAWL